MSWSGFKKAISRAGGSVVVKATDRVSDKDYDIQERRFKLIEKSGKELQKEAKAFLDAVRAVTASQSAMGEVVDSIYSNSEQAGQSNVGSYYLQAVQDFDQETVKQLDGPFREAVLDPVSKFCMYFSEINEAMKKRSHKKIDYEQAKAKVRRLTDHPSKDASKLPRAQRELDMAKDIYDSLNDQLKTELPQLINLRIPWYDPSFEALVKIQMRFCTEGYARLAQVQQYLDQTSRDEYANGVLDQRVEQKLGEMAQLNICSLGLK